MSQLPWQNQPRTSVVPITIEDYDKARSQYMGSHMLELFRFSPRQCQWKMQGLVPSTTKSYYDFGRALHCFVLEGATAFHERYQVAEGPVNPKTGNPYGRDTKAYESWYAEITADGRQICSGVEYTQIQMMAESLQESCARDLLHCGHPEITIRGQMHGVSCQSRLDFVDFDQAILVDLKTTESLSRFEKDFWKFGYHRQMAFYRGMLDGTNIRPAWQVFVIAIEKAEPYRCHAWPISEATLASADEENKQNLLQFRQLVNQVGWAKPWPLSLEYGRSLGNPL